MICDLYEFLKRYHAKNASTITMTMRIALIIHPIGINMMMKIMRRARRSVIHDIIYRCDIIHSYLF